MLGLRRTDSEREIAHAGRSRKSDGRSMGEFMNQQAFTNSLRAITGDKREYPEHKQLEPVQIALNGLEEFEAVLHSQKMLPYENAPSTDTGWLARIEMRVNELRELITTGEIV